MATPTQTLSPYVYPPEAMQDEWVVRAPVDTQTLYENYYHTRTLDPEAHGWTYTIATAATRNLINIAQTASAFAFQGYTGIAMTTVIKNEVVYHGARKVVERAHARYVAGTRVPIEHTRVADVVTKLGLIKECQNAHVLIERIQKAYTKSYFASKSSDELMTYLSLKINPKDKTEITPRDKIDMIIDFLVRRAKLKKYEEILYNNGKWLFQVIVCLTEKSTIDSAEK